MKPAKVGVAGMQKKKKKKLLGLRLCCLVSASSAVLKVKSQFYYHLHSVAEIISVFLFFFNFTRQLATTVGYFGVALLGVNIAI